MHRIETWDNKEKIIKRLSKYEKRILWNLEGEIINTKAMRELIGIPHRSSMSRVTKTLEDKGLIKADPRFNGKYKKILSLTPAGEQVVEWINNEVPISELIIKNPYT